jgi:hypothetical protein
MFTSTFNKGFQMTFENGWTISVQWGARNYCENNNFQEYDRDEWTKRDPMYDCNNAEVAIWRKEDDKWYTFENGDTVKGWSTPDEVAELINKVSKW